MKRIFFSSLISLVIFVGLVSLATASQARPRKETASSLSKISQMTTDGKGHFKVIITANDSKPGSLPLECLVTDLDSNYQCGPDQSWGCYQGNWVFSLDKTDTAFDTTLESIRQAMNTGKAVTIQVGPNCHLQGLSIAKHP
jgi:hypothetical protein